MNKLSTSSKNSMHTREITAVVLLGVLIPCVLFGNWAFFILMVLLSIVGVSEILRAPGPKKYNIWVKLVVYVFVLSFIFWVFLKNYLSDHDYYSGNRFYMTDIFVSITGIILYALVLFLIAVITPKVQLSDVTYLFTMGIVFALGFQGMFFLRYFPNGTGVIRYTDYLTYPSWNSSGVAFGEYFTSYYSAYNLNQTLCSSVIFFFMLIGTWAGDAGAYFVGILFGKHRMNPRISPHKTWEGFFGGMLISIVCSLSFAALLEYGFNIPLIPGLVQFHNSDLLLSMNVLGGHAVVFMVILAALMPIAGNVGGFLYSLVKRQFGIKDFGTIFPGHGGVIDRFDSIMINSIAMSIIIYLTANAWAFTL